MRARLIWRFASVALMLLASVPSAPAQTAADPRAASTPGPEEAAAIKLFESNRHRDALVQLDAATRVYRQAGDQRGLVRVALRRSGAWRVLGDLVKAAEAADEAQRLSAGDASLEQQAITQVARVAIDRGDLARAETSLKTALAIADRLNDATAQATVLRNLSTVADRRGLNLEALDYTTRSVAAADRSGDVPLRVRNRGVLAVNLLALSRFDEALAAGEESAAIAARAGLPALHAEAQFYLAQSQAHVWNLDRAAELWAATIEGHRNTGNSLMVALALKQSVETWFALGDFERAAADGEKAVDLLGQTGQAFYVAETMARVALSDVRRGANAEARAWADRARAALAATPESRRLFVHNDLGLVEAELGENAVARADFEQVLRFAQQLGNVEYEWRSHWGFGRTALNERPADAIPHLERAIAIVERLRQTIPEAGLRASFMTNRVGPYETLVEAHMATAAGPEDASVQRALEVAERARSRALADLLAESRARMSDQRLAALREEETAFGRRFSEVQKRIAAAPSPAVRTAALQELQALEREYETLVVRIRRDNPSYAALAHPRALAAKEISAMLAPDEALVEIFLTDKQGFAWVVRRDGIRGYRVPGAKALDPQVRLLTALLAARDEPAIRQLGAQLHSSLLGPAEPSLRGTRRLLIVADGVLQRLPFALLRSNDRWLVQSHTIAMTPSATILQFLRDARPPRAAEPLLALAVPKADPGLAAVFDGAAQELGPLPFAVEEVGRARRLLRADPRSARVGAEATELVLKSPEASRHRIVHLAAHAVADEIVPRRSAVMLAPGGDEDGLLQVSEIANLSLNADLVVLAACRSHVGRLVRGEGLLSLSRAFIHAGARAVVATAWTVPDRETAWLMQRFYAGLRDGRAPDEALRQAQLDAIGSGGRRSDPRTWAAFIIVGEAQSPILDPPVPARPSTLVLVAGAVIFLFTIAAATMLIAGRLTGGSAETESSGGPV